MSLTLGKNSDDIYRLNTYNMLFYTAFNAIGASALQYIYSLLCITNTLSKKLSPIIHVTNTSSKIKRGFFGAANAFQKNITPISHVINSLSKIKKRFFWFGKRLPKKI